MKTYVITLPSYFPITHRSQGVSTLFCESIKAGLHLNNGVVYSKNSKIHTIRDIKWEKRIKDVQEGKAVLSIRIWTDKPYHSKQMEIVKLTNNDGIGTQRMYITRDFAQSVIDGKHYSTDLIAQNDGLRIEDWISWLINRNMSDPLLIIHFTKFRY